MDPAALAASIVSMNTASVRMDAQFALLRKQFDMQKEAMNMLLPTAQAPAAPGTGRLVDKTA